MQKFHYIIIEFFVNYSFQIIGAISLGEALKINNINIPFPTYNIIKH
jgi:hypothetical protein